MMKATHHERELWALLDGINIDPQKKAKMLENFRHIEPGTQAKLNTLARLIMGTGQSVLH